MVKNNKFKYIGKIIKEGYWSIIANRCSLPFLRTGTIAACFHRVGYYCCDKLKLKICLRIGTKYITTTLNNDDDDDIIINVTCMGGTRDVNEGF
jgi:hypothetical protein